MNVVRDMKAACTPLTCIHVVPDFSRFTHPLQELGQDVTLISFCMCGINSVDLFYAEKNQYYDGIFHYNRRKTRKLRSDSAYCEIRVPQFIKPTIEKYLSKDMESPSLFDFQERLSTPDSFNSNVNAGILGIYNLLCTNAFQLKRQKNDDDNSVDIEKGEDLTFLTLYNISRIQLISVI